MRIGREAARQHDGLIAALAAAGAQALHITLNLLAARAQAVGGTRPVTPRPVAE